MKLLFLFGPNLNLLGRREPEIYGIMTYEELQSHIAAVCTEHNVKPLFFQSNHEGALIDAVQNAKGTVDGIVINAGGYSHTSIALMDALKAVALPAVEVHLSNTQKRESFRRFSYTALACAAVYTGLGAQGYDCAIEFLTNMVK